MAGNNDSGRTIQYDKWEIVTGLDFSECFLIRDPTQAKIENPDYDDTEPESSTNAPTVYPPLDLNNYSGKMDIRTGNTRDSTLIHTIESPAGGMTFNDPAVGWVKLFIDRSLTGAEAANEGDPKEIGDYADQCSFYDLFIDPNQPGEKNRRIFKGELPIIESTTEV